MYSLSLVLECPPSTPGIQALLAQQLFIKSLLSFRYRNGHWGYGSEKSNTKPPSNSIHPRGFFAVVSGSLGLQEVPIRAPPYCPCLHAHALLPASQPSLVITCAQVYAHARIHAHTPAYAPTLRGQGRGAEVRAVDARVRPGAAYPEAASAVPLHRAGGARRRPARSGARGT